MSCQLDKRKSCGYAPRVMGTTRSPPTGAPDDHEAISQAPATMQADSRSMQIFGSLTEMIDTV